MSDDTHNDAVSSLMSRNKFEECLQYLHLSDNSKLLKDDKYAKVRPLCKLINEKCQQNFIPEKNISIDESMVAYFGRHSTKQYMKAKPTKFGYKIWCAATRLGYVIAFEPYQGAGTFMNDKRLGMAGTAVSYTHLTLPTILLV